MAILLCINKQGGPFSSSLPMNHRHLQWAKAQNIHLAIWNEAVGQRDFTEFTILLGRESTFIKLPYA